MNAIRFGACLAAVTVLAGCQTFPRYTAPQGSDTATVDVSRANVTVLCADGKGYTVSTPPGRKLSVPTNLGRVTLYSFIYLADYNVSYSCQPGLSFQPKAGEEYLFNIELEDQMCLPDLYRKEEGSRVGLAMEASVARPGACAMPGK